MRGARLFLDLLVLAFLASGCVIAKRVRSPVTEVRLRVVTARPRQYSIRVALDQPADYPVAADGHLSFTVPSVKGGCDVYLFGAIKVQDGSAENVRVVEVRREGRVIRRLSLSQIAKLLKDEAGYDVVKVGD